MDNFNFKKYLAEGKLLKENAPGYDTRKMGEALPTLESVKAAYEAKNDIKEDAREFEEDNSSDYEVMVSLLGKLAGLVERNIENSENFDLEDMSQVIGGYYDEMKELGGFEKYEDEMFESKGKLKENLSDRAEELEMDFMDPRNKFGDEWQEEVSNVLVRKYDGHWENWENENPDELEMLLTKFKNLLAEDMSYEAKNDIKEEASKAKELSDRVLTVASEGIKDLNGTELMEFRALIAQAFDMKDEA